MNIPNFEELVSQIDRERAERAYHWSSLHPEERGESVRKAYAERVLAYADALDKRVPHWSDADKQAKFDAYRTKMLALYDAFIAAQSRCASWHVTGPSRFPVAKAQVALNRAMAAENAISDYQAAALRALDKAAHPENAPIMAGDADALERLHKKLESCRALQERMKTANKAIRAAKGNREKAMESLQALGYSAAQANTLLTEDFLGRVGYADYELANNNAEIRRIKERIAKIEQMRAMPETEQENADGVRMVINGEAARIQLFFPGKPDADTRADLKRHGFRWAPSCGAWQANINTRARQYAESIIQK